MKRIEKQIIVKMSPYSYDLDSVMPIFEFVRDIVDTKHLCKFSCIQMRNDAFMVQTRSQINNVGVKCAITSVNITKFLHT